VKLPLIVRSPVTQSTPHLDHAFASPGSVATEIMDAADSAHEWIII
jgi:hypothetical protein